MGKFFGLFIFLNFFAVGILIGSRRGRFTPRVLGKVLAWFLGVYLVMGIILKIDLSFVFPK